MKSAEIISILQELNNGMVLSAKKYYDALEACGVLKTNYYNYMTAHPIECDRELQRLPSADYDTCCALLTMLLREDYVSNGSFERRQQAGQVKPILDKILTILSSDSAQSLKQFSEKHGKR